MQESKKSIGRSLVNSSRSRSSQKFMHMLCVHHAYVIHRQQTARQVDRQTHRHRHMEICLIWVKLPSVWVVAGSWSNKCIRLLSCNFLWGADWVNPLAQWCTWEGALCQVGTRLVKLAGLSSKSNCNICCTWSSGCMFDLCIPVSSLQYQLIGKFLGSGSLP